MEWLLVFLLGAAVSLLLTPLVRVLARAYALVDRPDGRRKLHARPIPLAGGPALLGAAAVVLAGALLLPNPFQQALAADGPRLLGLLFGAVVIAAVGVADDYGRLRGRQKLLGQLLAVLVVIKFGLVIRTFRLFGAGVELGLLAVPVTALWLLAAINSLNLMDGMDGLLSAVGIIISVALAGVALVQGHPAAACVAAVMAGALLGFLRYNFPPASAFLGDSGSMLIGLVIGALAIEAPASAPGTFAAIVPLTLLAIPFFDTSAAIVRRKLTGRSIFSTDRAHLHHCLLRRGLSGKGVLLWVAVFCAITAGGGLAAVVLRQEAIACATGAGVITAMIAGRWFGHAEFRLLTMTLAAPLRGRARGRHAASQAQVRLQGSADWARWWARIVSRAPELDLKMVRLNVNAPALHEGYHARWDCAHGPAEDGDLWRTEMPLVVQGQTVGRLEILGERNGGPVWQKLAAVLELIDGLENEAPVLVEPALRPQTFGPLNPITSPVPGPELSTPA